MDNRQLVFIPLDSSSEPTVQEDSLVATSAFNQNKFVSPSIPESDRQESLTVSLALKANYSSQATTKLESALIKSSHGSVQPYEPGLEKENTNSTTTECIQAQSCLEEVYDSLNSQQTSDSANSTAESSLQGIYTSTEVSLETAIAQLEKSVGRKEGVANLGFLQLTCTTLDILMTYLWKINVPCFCLHLQGNLLSSLPDSISLFSETITHLYLQDNQLQIFPLSLCLLKKLRVLDLSRNRLQYLPEEISNLENLVILDVSNNDIKQLPASK